MRTGSGWGDVGRIGRRHRNEGHSSYRINSEVEITELPSDKGRGFSSSSIM